MKLIPKLIIALTRLEEKNVRTVFGNKPKSIYCVRDTQNNVQGLLFLNTNEYERLKACGQMLIKV